jgi:hypothetical protein
MRPRTTRQAARPAEGDVGVEAEALAAGQAQAREPAGQLLERQLRLQPAEAGPWAVVHPAAEREMVGDVGPVEVEPLRLGEDAGVPAGGGEPEEQPGALGQRHAADRDRPGGDPPPDRDRRVEPERLLDCCRDQPPVVRNRVPARRVLQQPARQVADQAGGGLMAGEAQREQDRGDLPECEPPGVLVVDRQQVAGEVVAAVTELGVDQLAQVAAVGGDVAGDLDLVGRRRPAP